jgi:hypothetical protein
MREKCDAENDRKDTDDFFHATFYGTTLNSMILTLPL